MTAGRTDGMTAPEAVAVLVRGLSPEDLALFTTGFISRDAQAAGDRPGHFYMIGSMGLASAVGLGLALAAPARRVVVVDGDGSLLMSLGTMAVIAHELPPNLLHIVIDNRAYASTGDQPSVSATVDLGRLAAAAGYPTVRAARTPTELAAALSETASARGPLFLHITVEAGRGPVPIPPRVALSPVEIAGRFRRAVAGSRA